MKFAPIEVMMRTTRGRILPIQSRRFEPELFGLKNTVASAKQRVMKKSTSQKSRDAKEPNKFDVVSEFAIRVRTH